MPKGASEDCPRIAGKPAIFAVAMYAAVACATGCQSTPGGGADAALAFESGAAGQFDSGDASGSRDVAEADGTLEADVETEVSDGSEGDAGHEFVALINLGENDECLGRGISFVSTCRILVDGVGAGCGAAGFSSASSDDTTAIQTRLQSGKGSLPTGAVCQLLELMPNVSGSGCADPEMTGWCYVHGSCMADAGMDCPAICTTPRLNRATGDDGPPAPFYVDAWLLCP